MAISELVMLSTRTMIRSPGSICVYAESSVISNSLPPSSEMTLVDPANRILPTPSVIYYPLRGNAAKQSSR